MAVTLETIATMLEEKEVKFHHDSEKEVIVFAAGDEDTTQSHFIRTREDGEMFQWQMQLLDDNKDTITIKDHAHAPVALSHMLGMNYNTKFGTWEYDLTDGDIRLAVEIPLEDALMTEKQFSRIFGYMIDNGQKGADAIRHILETGKIPEDNSDAEMLAKLEALMELLQKGSASSEDGI